MMLWTLEEAAEDVVKMWHELAIEYGAFVNRSEYEQRLAGRVAMAVAELKAVLSLPPERRKNPLEELSR
jgi:hypothetical protein